MHTLNILIAATFSIAIAGTDQTKQIDAPVMRIPLSDPIGFAIENGLELVKDRAADGHPEIVAKGSIPGVKIARIFGRDIKTPDITDEIDIEVWVTSDDEPTLAVALEYIGEQEKRAAANAAATQAAEAEQAAATAPEAPAETAAE